VTSNNPPSPNLDDVLAFVERLAAGEDLPTLVLRLKKAFPTASSEILSLAAEIVTARDVAPDKLGEWARGGFFSHGVLQQASRAAIATQRSSYFSGCRHVLEIGTGSGSDTAALARVAAHVTTVEHDRATAELAQRNLVLQGITNVTCVVGHAEELVPALIAACDSLFADPARRTRSGERVKEGEEYSPPLSWVLGLSVPGVRAIKVSPGLFVEPAPPGCARQFVGVGDECLEQTLWFNSPVRDSSVVLADRGIVWAPSGTSTTIGNCAGLSGFLSEAHAVVNRSQYLREFFSERGISLVADDVAYGISPTAPTPSPLLDRFRIVTDFAYQSKRLKEKLHELGWSNRTEFKKRAMALDPESLRREMGLPEHSHNAPFGVVFIFPWRGKPWVVLAERIRD